MDPAPPSAVYNLDVILVGNTAIPLQPRINMCLPLLLLLLLLLGFLHASIPKGNTSVPKSGSPCGIVGEPLFTLWSPWASQGEPLQDLLLVLSTLHSWPNSSCLGKIYCSVQQVGGFIPPIPIKKLEIFKCCEPMSTPSPAPVKNAFLVSFFKIATWSSWCLHPPQVDVKTVCQATLHILHLQDQAKFWRAPNQSVTPSSKSGA